MRSSDLMLGQRYRIRYRNMTYNSNTGSYGCNYSESLKDGYGELIGLYTVAGYNHTFQLDDGTKVWVTPNSIYPIPENRASNSIVSDVIGDESEDALTLNSIVSFLSGLEIPAEIIDGKILISEKGISNLKNLIVKMYSDILDI